MKITKKVVYAVDFQGKNDEFKGAKEFQEFKDLIYDLGQKYNSVQTYPQGNFGYLVECTEPIDTNTDIV